MTLSITSQKRGSDVHPAAERTEQQTQATELHARATFTVKTITRTRPTSHLCFQSVTRLSTSRADTAIISQREQQNCRNPLNPAVKSDTLMAATVEDLYRNYGILADAKEDLSTVNKASYICAVAQYCNNSLYIFRFGGFFFC